MLAHVIDHPNQEDAGEPCVSGSPAEPVKRSWHQLGNNDLLSWAVELCLKRPVDPVEEVEVSDPGYSGENVQPPEDCF